MIIKIENLLIDFVFINSHFQKRFIDRKNYAAASHGD
jgi:hypothetical protein